jgi:hypothetical protein
MPVREVGPSFEQESEAAALQTHGLRKGALDQLGWSWMELVQRHQETILRVALLAFANLERGTDLLELVRVAY